jgi:hypothetical protein
MEVHAFEAAFGTAPPRFQEPGSALGAGTSYCRTVLPGFAGEAGALGEVDGITGGHARKARHRPRRGAGT